MISEVGLGRHLIVEMYNCPWKYLDSLNYIREKMIEAAEASNSIILNYNFHKFSPQGVTGVVIVSESHLSIHTWPEYGYAAIDIFTCGKHTDPWKALEVLKNALKPKNMNVIEFKRGILIKKLIRV